MSCNLDKFTTYRLGQVVDNRDEGMILVELTNPPPSCPDRSFSTHKGRIQVQPGTQPTLTWSQKENRAVVTVGRPEQIEVVQHSRHPILFFLLIVFVATAAMWGTYHVVQGYRAARRRKAKGDDEQRRGSEYRRRVADDALRALERQREERAREAQKQSNARDSLQHLSPRERKRLKRQRRAQRARELRKQPPPTKPSAPPRPPAYPHYDPAPSPYYAAPRSSGDGMVTGLILGHLMSDSHRHEGYHGRPYDEDVVAPPTTVHGLRDHFYPDSPSRPPHRPEHTPSYDPPDTSSSYASDSFDDGGGFSTVTMGTSFSSDTSSSFDSDSSFSSDSESTFGND